MAHAIVIKEYVSQSGKSPFREWLNTLDNVVKARIQARLFRFETGNFGDHKSVGEGVLEARFDFGPGYRLYFAVSGTTFILLLAGGDKKSQRKDIRKAQEFLRDYLEHENNG